MIKQLWDWIQTLFHKRDKYAGLRRYNIFKQLSSFELYLLNNYMHQRKFKAGELLFEKDYPLEVVYFIEKGEIEVTGGASPGGKRILKKNQFLGLLDMFHENIRSSKAVAITEVVTLAISRTDLMDYINHNPKAGIKILTSVCIAFSNYIFSFAAASQEKTAEN